MKAPGKIQTPLYFLSFLGTSDYVPCHYVFNKGSEAEFCSSLVKYTQEAVLEAKANEVDKIVIFLTGMARSRNWEGEGKLKERLQNMGYDESKIKEVDVPDGFSRDQLLGIFEAFVQAVEPGARIIMDVTHAFRSLPLLSVTSLNYLKSLRNIAIEGIYYGAFEALGPAREVENIPPEKRKAEMIDLLVLNALQEWAAAVRVLMQYGNPDYLVALTKSNINPILAQTKGKDPIAVDLRKVVGFIEDAFAAVRFVRLKDIYGMSKADEAQKALESVLDNPKVLSPLRPVLKELKSLIGNLKENSLDNAWVVLDWCLKYEWYAIGVNLLCEHVLTAILAAHEKPHEDRAHRTTLSSAFNIRLNEISEEKWRVEDRDLAREMLDWEEVENEELVKFFAEKLANLRNDVQHAGMRENPAKRTKIAANFEGLLEEAKRYFLAAQTQA
jgi:CRISPR-associated Csx2 family protein